MADNTPLLAGRRLTKLELHVPWLGPWYADCVLDDTADLSGRQTLTWGDVQLQGTIAPSFSGAFIGLPTVRLVAGANGWSKAVRPKAYHNDAGVKLRTVAADVASEVGETTGTLPDASSRFGSDYVRFAGRASLTLTRCAQLAAWYVDYAGVTHIGDRSSPLKPPPTALISNYDPRSHVVVAKLSSLADVAIGMTLSDPRFPSDLVVRELLITAAPDGLEARLWCGPAANPTSRLGSAFRNAVRQVTDGTLNCKYRYRVVSQNSDGRLNLQAVRRGSHPDAILVPVRMGVPGISADHTPGTEVLVEFIEGDPSLPIVTAYPDQRSSEFTADKLTIGGTTGPAAARVGDTVKILLPPAVCTVIVGGVPSPGTIVFPTGYTLGQIMTGSGKVDIAT